jgi:hypothetical protein
MNNPQTHKRSHVVPKWFEYPKAIAKGELVVPRKVSFELNKVTKDSIQTDLEEFSTNQTSIMACRLMGAGLVIGDVQLSHDMAEYVVKNSGVDLLSIKLADKILHVNTDIAPLSAYDVRISKLRKWVSEYPRDAIAWIELSRVFTIKGQIEKAKRAATIAIKLAPSDRYIVRCVARLFLHTKDFDQALYYTQNASKNKFDPWIKATEINVALISQLKISDIKKFIPKNLSHDEIFHFSELLESAGLLELDSGNDRKARKQLRLAWENPSDNVITHAEWILRNRLPSMKELHNLNFDRSYEATTWVNYVDLKIKRALESAREWELEEPYSKYPFIVGSSIATISGQPSTGAEIAKRGLLINPNSIGIYNNLCYSLLRAGNITEASKYIDKLKIKDGTIQDLFCQATLGLYAYKIKKYAEGREAYLEVINQFKKNNETDLQAEAILNFALSELDASTPESREIAISSLENTETMKNPTIILLRKLLKQKMESNLSS